MYCARTGALAEGRHTISWSGPLFIFQVFVLSALRLASFDTKELLVKAITSPLPMFQGYRARGGQLLQTLEMHERVEP